jgi:hypothetical protein
MPVWFIVQVVKVVVFVWHVSHEAVVGMCPVAGFVLTSLYAPPWQVAQPVVMPV